MGTSSHVSAILSHLCPIFLNHILPQSSTTHIPCARYFRISSPFPPISPPFLRGASDARGVTRYTPQVMHCPLDELAYLQESGLQVARP